MVNITTAAAFLRHLLVPSSQHPRNNTTKQAHLKFFLIKLFISLSSFSFSPPFFTIYLPISLFVCLFISLCLSDCSSPALSQFFLAPDIQILLLFLPSRIFIFGSRKCNSLFISPSPSLFLSFSINSSIFLPDIRLYQLTGYSDASAEVSPKDYYIKTD